MSQPESFKVEVVGWKEDLKTVLNLAYAMINVEMGVATSFHSYSLKEDAVKRVNEKREAVERFHGALGNAKIVEDS